MERQGDLSKLKPADLILITDDVNHHLDVKAIAKLRKARRARRDRGQRSEAGA